MRTLNRTFKTAKKTMSTFYGMSQVPFKLSLFQLVVLEELAQADALSEDFRVETLCKPELAQFCVYILIFIDPETEERVRVQHCYTYTGSTNDCARRFIVEHSKGRGSALTRKAINNGLELKIGAMFFTDKRYETEFYCKDNGNGNDFLYQTGVKETAVRTKTIIAGTQRNYDNVPALIAKRKAKNKAKRDKWLASLPNRQLDEASRE